MSAQFEVTIDKADVERRLGELSSKAPQAIARALNWTAKSARTRLANRAKEAYTVKSVGFADSLKIKNATAGHLVAELNSAGEPLLIKRFSIRSGKNGVSAMIVKGSGYKSLTKGGIKAYKLKSSGNIRQREGAERYPNKGLYGNSIPAMLGSERHVYGIVEPHINSDLQKNLSQVIAKLVG